MDPHLLERAAVEKKRLLAEKELRQLLSNITIEMASPENLENLTQKVETADTCKVAEEYVSKGKELKEKFILNLDAKDIMAKFRDYPIREYPVVEEVDPKKKSKFNNIYNNIFLLIFRKRSTSTEKKEKKEGTTISYT